MSYSWFKMFRTFRPGMGRALSGIHLHILASFFLIYIYMYIIIYTYMLRVPVGEFPRVFDSFNSELSPPASCDSHVGSLVSCLIPVTVNPIMLQTGEMHQNLGQNWM